MKRTCIILVCLLSCLIIQAQSVWRVLPHSPAQTFRSDDIFFLDEDNGWIVNVKGQVWRTRDGGDTWNLLTTQPTSFRCVGFIDSLNGFIGNLSPGAWAPTNDTVPLYKTTDGGKTWIPVLTFNGPLPRGICGIRVVNKDVIVGCGRVEGPTFFIRSVDGGKTWASKDMSAYAGQIIDLSFIAADTGFIVGGTDSAWQKSRSIILYTTDGGINWTPKITGTSTGDHCWKIEKTTNNTYYASVERGSPKDTLKYFKSTNGGNTWSEHYIHERQYGFSQGIGFINDTVGWIAGDNSALMTTDGGKTFTDFPLFTHVNRIRFVGNVGYAVGWKAYKFSSFAAGMPTETAPDFSGYGLTQNVPNPFSNSTEITYRIPKAEHVYLEVYDNAGRLIKSLVNEHQQVGTHSATFNLTIPADDMYTCAMRVGGFVKAIKMYSFK